LDNGSIEPRDYLTEGIENVKREVLNNIDILGSAGRV